MPGQHGNDPWGTALSPTQQKVLQYLLAHTSPDAYLAATLDSHGASPFILASGRAFLVFGSYIGDDNVITPAQLQDMIAGGRLRFVLDNGNLAGKPAIHDWVMSRCRVVHVPGIQQPSQPVIWPPVGGPRNQQFSALYDCRG